MGGQRTLCENNLKSSFHFQQRYSPETHRLNPSSLINVLRTFPSSETIESRVWKSALFSAMFTSRQDSSFLFLFARCCTVLPPVGQWNSSKLPVDLSSYISLQDLTNSALRGNKKRNQQVQQLETPQRPVKSLFLSHKEIFLSQGFWLERWVSGAWSYVYLVQF